MDTNLLTADRSTCGRRWSPCSARRFVIVDDESKYVARLTYPVPVEVPPFEARLVESG